MKKYICIIILLVVSVASSRAQQTSEFSISYNVSFGMGDLNDFIGKTSFRGGAVEWKTYIHERLSAGIEGNWTTFYEERDYETYQVRDNINISGKQFRYANMIPIYVRADWYSGNEGDDIRFFGGMGVGTIWSEQILDMGLYEIRSDVWHFGLSPRAGIKYYFNEWRALTLGVNYDYGFKTKEEDPLNFLRLMIGINFIN